MAVTRSQRASTASPTASGLLDSTDSLSSGSLTPFTSPLAEHVAGRSSGERPPLYPLGPTEKSVALALGVSPKKIRKLSSNESCVAMPSPKVTEAIKKAMTSLTRYPDDGCPALRAKLSERFGLASENFIFGNGSDEVIRMAAHALTKDDREVLYSQMSYPAYHIATLQAGAVAVKAKATTPNAATDSAPATPGCSIDLKAMLNCVTQATGLICVPNPNNPSGSYLTGAEIKKFLEDVKQKNPDAVVVLDEAYKEFVEPHLQFDSVRLIEEFPNLLVTRTFSKAHGLANLRIGYAMAQPDLINRLEPYRNPHNVNGLAQVAAEAALDDPDHLQKTVRITAEGKQQLIQGLSAMGLQPLPSQSNFIAVNVGADTQAARNICELVQEQRVLLRPCGDDMPGYVRISIGTESQNDVCLLALGNATGRSVHGGHGLRDLLSRPKRSVQADADPRLPPNVRARSGSV